MRTVYEFQLFTVNSTTDGPRPRAEFMIPKGSTPLTVQLQREAICAWFSVDTTMPGVCYRIELCGTGLEAPSAELGDYLGTVQLDGGALVLHAFGGVIEP